jgi:hypothetical protein
MANAGQMPDMSQQQQEISTKNLQESDGSSGPNNQAEIAVLFQ